MKRILCLTLACAGCAGLDAGSGGQRAETVGSAEVDAGAAVSIRLSNADVATAGAVLPALGLPAGANAVLVEADVDAASARSVTFAAIDADAGETIGYWQNPVAVPGPSRLAAALDLARPAGAVRVFAGTQDQASKATISGVTCQPLRLGPAYRSAVYGALVNTEKTPSQTFRATGTHLGAVMFRCRQQRQRTDGPGLRVRLYRWLGDVASTRAGDPIAESAVPRSQIPEYYSHGERDLSLALSAATEPGSMYLLEWAAAGPCAADQGLLLWAGPDTGLEGEHFVNNRAVGWDVYVQFYDSMW